MTFSRIRGENFDQLALTHDMFLLKPFTDTLRYALPIFSEHINNIDRLLGLLNKQLLEQPDWYWSCRSRSYFMEIMLLLERTYGSIGESDHVEYADTVQNSNLKKAVMYIESNYAFDLTLETVVKSASSNHSTLNKMFKAELNMTPIEYLWYYRLSVAKRFLEFTDLPIKEIALRCGFKTTQHFSRKFEETFDCNPSTFRTLAVEKRKNEFRNNAV
jgi:AraC family L-rhamnose operon regulatory protein RhaS